MSKGKGEPLEGGAVNGSDSVDDVPQLLQSSVQMEEHVPRRSFFGQSIKEEMVGPFIMGKVLGRGMTGKVRLGTHYKNGKKVAIKILQKKILKDEGIRRRVKREIGVLKLVHHPNVMRLFDVRETRRHLFLIMEHVDGGELFDYILKKGRLPRAEALRFIAQIVQGLEHCQHYSICHRDLKPENILLDKNRNVKIADFGMAQLMKHGAQCGTSCGSPHYASPEVISGNRYNGQISDVWSVGVILFALVSAQLPFDSPNIPDLLEKVQRGVFRMPSCIDPDVAHLIRRMLTVNVKERIRMHEIKYHPCFQSPNKAVKVNENSPLKGLDLSTDGVSSFFPKTDEFQREAEEIAAMARTHTLKSADEIAPDLLFDLQGVGLGTKEELVEALCAKDFNQVKVFYLLLIKRRAQRSNETELCSPRSEGHAASPSVSSPRSPSSPSSKVRVDVSAPNSPAPLPAPSPSNKKGVSLDLRGRSRREGAAAIKDGAAAINNDFKPIEVKEMEGDGEANDNELLEEEEGSPSPRPQSAKWQKCEKLDVEEGSPRSKPSRRPLRIPTRRSSSPVVDLPEVKSPRSEVSSAKEEKDVSSKRWRYGFNPIAIDGVAATPTNPASPSVTSPDREDCVSVADSVSSAGDAKVFQGREKAKSATHQAVARLQEQEVNSPITPTVTKRSWFSSLFRRK